MHQSRLRGTAILLAAIAISALVADSVCAAEPEFQGKSAAVWFERLTSHDDAEREAAVKAIAADPQHAKPVLDEFVRQLETRDILYRFRLRKALAAVGTAALSSLLEGMKSADATVMHTSFAALHYTKVPAAELAEALTRLLPNPNQAMEAKVFFALNNMGFDAVPALIDVANNPDPKNAFPRDVAFCRLCDLGPKTSPMVTVILGRLEDQSAEIRRKAADALRALPAADEARAVLALRKVANRDLDANVRAAARASLGYMLKISGPHAAANAAQANRILRIHGDLYDRDPATVRRAIYEAGELAVAAKETERSLSALLFDPDFSTRSLAAAALVLVTGNPDSLEVIQDGIRKMDSLSEQVIELLIKIGLDAVPVLLDAEQHAKDEDVRENLTANVDSIAVGKGDKQALQDLLAAESPRVRGWATDKLLEIGDTSPKTLAALAKQMKDADRRVREKAAFALMELGQVAIPSLIDVAQDKNPLVRRKAVYVMTVIGRPLNAAVDALIRALDDEDETVRFWACIALGRVKHQQMRLAPLLTARQTDSSEKVRTAARNAFQQLTLNEPDQ